MLQRLFQWFESRINPYPETTDHSPNPSFTMFCWRLSHSIWPWLIVMTVLSAMIAVSEVFLYSSLGSLVEWLAQSNPDTLIDDQSYYLIAMSGFILLGLPLIKLANTLVIFQSLMGNFPMIARWDFHQRMLKQSMAFFANEFAGRTATKLMQTALSVRETVMKIFDVLTFVSIYFLSLMVVIGWSEWQLTLPLWIWLGLYVSIIAYFTPKLREVSQAQSLERSTMTGRIVDTYTHIQLVKLFSHTQRESAYAQAGMQGFLNSVHQQMRLVTRYDVLIYFNNCLAIFLMGLFSIRGWQNGNVSLGAITLAMTATLRLQGMSQWIMWEMAGLFENIGIIYDGMTTLTQTQTVQDSPRAQALVIDKGLIQLKQVVFGYHPDKPVINGLDLNIQPGEKIGIIGRTGAGKSSLINCLLRFYDIQSGHILFDGQNIAEVTQDSLRSQFSVVAQEGALMNRNIRDNIAYAAPDASDSDIQSACKKAGAWSFIQTLTDSEGRSGLDVMVGERGVKLSGGQRQRIAIARMFLKNAPIVILDEATSALDSEVEAVIQEQIQQIMADKTVIAIAHRLSTIAHLDRLIVIDQGQIVEEGDHQSLLKQQGLYYQLWKKQSSGFLDA